MNKTRRRKRARRHRADQIAYLRAWRDEMMSQAVELEPGIFMVELDGLPDDEDYDGEDIPF